MTDSLEDQTAIFLYTHLCDQLVWRF